jgi:hypothetical protein
MASDVLIGVVLILIGALSLFFGWQLFRLILALVGLTYGAAIGSLIANSIAPGEQTLALVLAIIVGLLLAILAGMLWSLAIYISGAFLGAAVGLLLAPSIGATGITQLVIVIGTAFLGLLLAIMLRKTIVILATAVNGAGLVMYGVSLFVPSLRVVAFVNGEMQIVSDSSTLALVILLVLALFGFLVQYNNSATWRRSTLL